MLIFLKVGGNIELKELTFYLNQQKHILMTVREAPKQLQSVQHLWPLLGELKELT